MSDSLRPHGPQHKRLPYPSPSPRASPNTCPLSRWCHPTNLSSVIPFSYLQFFPASGCFPVSQFFTSGGQCIGASASASVLLMNIQGWFPLDGLLRSPCCPRASQESSPTPQFKSINSLALSLLNGPSLTYIHDYYVLDSPNPNPCVLDSANEKGHVTWNSEVSRMGQGLVGWIYGRSKWFPENNKWGGASIPAFLDGQVAMLFMLKKCPLQATCDFDSA